MAIRNSNGYYSAYLICHFYTITKIIGFIRKSIKKRGKDKKY